MSSCITSPVNNNQGSAINQPLKLATSGFISPKGDYLNIKITEKAKIALLQKVSIKKTAIGIKILISTKGCSGLAYKMEYAEPGINITEKDEIIECGDTCLFIDPKSSLFFFNMQIDYEDDGINAGFKFNNPSSKGSCGCGESFFV